MSKIVQFPLPSAQRPSAHVAARLLDKPPPHAHVVQFYDDQEFLFETIALFLQSGLDAGEAALIIARPSHQDGILRALGSATHERAARSGQLLLIDAEVMLARLMVDDEPDESLLIDAFDRMLASMPPTQRARPALRAFGEMVDVLWERGQPAAAIRLEELWNRIVSQRADAELSLMCAYSMRDFYKSEATSPFRDVCRLHTHVLPTERFSHDGDGFERLRDISQLEQRARLLENEVQYREELERTLRQALEDRSRLEAELRASQAREREALLVAHTGEAYTDALFRMLDPMKTLIATTRLLAQPRSAPLEASEVERLTATIERVQRSIECILDVAPGRLSSHTEVVARYPRDVAAVVAQGVAELRQAHPDVRFELLSPGPCLAPLDSERFRHVVLELGHHAVELADPASAITIQVSEHVSEVTVRVHHRGKPIAPELFDSLFDPSRPLPPASARRSTGIGTRLFVAHLIVRGHGGRVEVSSTAEAGTAILARLPRLRRAP